MDEERKPHLQGPSTSVSAPQKRNRLFLSKSGMKVGSLFQYFHKKPKIEDSVVQLPQRIGNYEAPTFVDSSHQNEDDDSDDDSCMIIQEVSKDKKARNVYIIDLCSDDESCLDLTNKSYAPTKEDSPIHIPASRLRPQNIRLPPEFQAVDLTLDADGERITETDASSHVVGCPEISRNLNEVRRASRQRSKNSEIEVIDSVDLTEEIVGVENPVKVVNPVSAPGRPLSDQAKRKCLIQISVESDDEVSLPMSEASEANKRKELAEDDTCKYDQGQPETPAETEREDIEATIHPSNGIEPTPEMLASETLNQALVSSQLPNGYAQNQGANIVDAEINETGSILSINKSWTPISAPVKDLPVQSQMSVDIHSRVTVYVDTVENRADSPVCTETPLKDSLILLEESDKNRIHSSPLRVSTNDPVYRLGPQKRVEKAYAIQHEQTPKSDQQPSSADAEENSENMPIITGSYSVRQLQFSENVGVPNTFTPSGDNSLQNEANNFRQEKVRNSKTPSRELNGNLGGTTNSSGKEIQIKKRLTIEDLIYKQSFGKAAQLVLKEVFDTRQLPKEFNLTALTSHMLCANRVAREVKLTIVNIWEQVFISHPIHSKRGYYLNVLLGVKTQENKPVDVPIGYTDILLLLLKAVREEEIKEKPMLKFLGLLTSAFNEEYQRSYLAQNVKRLRPILLEFLSSDHLSNYAPHVSFLVQELFLLYEWQDPFYLVLSWISLLGDHFYNFTFKNGNSSTMTSAICNHLRQEKYVKWNNIIAKMSPLFGEKVCLELLKDIVYSSPRFPSMEPTQEDKEKDKQTLATFLENFKEIIKAGVEYEKEFSHAPPIPAENCNRFGEKKLHLLVKREKLDALEKYLQKARTKLVDVNVVDNNANTAFHDACDNASCRSFGLMMRFQAHNLHVYDDASIPNNFAVNMLAKNAHGNTPLHLLAARKRYTSTTLFKYMANKKGIFVLCTLMRNDDGKKPRDFCTDPTDREVQKMLEPAIEFHGYDILAPLTPLSRLAVDTDPRFLELVKLWYLFNQK